MTTPVDTPSRILLIRPSALGDVCRTVPVVASLRRAWPDAEIDWVVQDRFVDAVRSHPGVSNVIPFPRQRFARWWRPGVAAELTRWLTALRTPRYDIVIDCQGLVRSGLMTFLSGARTRVGLRTAREFAWLGYTVRHRPGDQMHTVDEMLSLLTPLGVEPVYDMSLHVDPAAERWWETQCREHGLHPERYAVMAPTTRWTSKRWPADRWHALLEPMSARGLRDVVTIASPEEASQVDEVGLEETPDGMRVVDFAGRTTIAQSMAIIARSGFVVAHDSAPLHMAVGFARRCVGLFGPTDPTRVGPYGHPDASVRGYDPPASEVVSFRDGSLGDRLMAMISVEDVVSAIDRNLADEPHATPVHVQPVHAAMPENASS